MSWKFQNWLLLPRSQWKRLLKCELYTVVQAYVVYPRKNQACILIKGSKPDLRNVATVSCHRLCSGPPSTERRSDQSIAPSLTFCHWGTYKNMDPRSMDHLCGPSPWSPALCGPSPRTNVSVKSKLQHAPPGQPPGHLTFLKIIVQISPYLGQNAVQMPHTRIHSGDQMPPPRGHFKGKKWQKDCGNAFSCRTKSL